MKKELDEKLQDRFLFLKRPELHREEIYEFIKGYSLYDNYGLEVGDGWFQLIWDLCIRIREYEGAKWVLRNGNKLMIKKNLFARWLDQQTEI